MGSGNEIWVGARPNPIYGAALSYLEAAEFEFNRQSQKAPGLWCLQDWFVAHHLGVISAELFLKSYYLSTTYSTSSCGEEPDEIYYKSSFAGHRAGTDIFPSELCKSLEEFLPSDLYNLMMSLSKDEISKGRYPYEKIDHEDATRFPVGDTGKELANSWLELCRKLRDFKFYG